LKWLFSDIKEKNTIIFFFLMFSIFAIAFDSSRTVDKQILNNYDKIKHIFAFFVLSYFLFESSINISKYFKFIILLSLAFIIEYVQSMIGREASLIDFVASSSGILLFIFIKFMFKKFSENK
jgi:hypothetical protein